LLDVDYARLLFDLLESRLGAEEFIEKPVSGTAFRGITKGRAVQTEETGSILKQHEAYDIVGERWRFRCVGGRGYERNGAERIGVQRVVHTAESGIVNRGRQPVEKRISYGFGRR